MKKFLSNTIVQLLIAVIIGLLAGFVVNDAVLEVVICIKHITGQIIFFLVPLIILGFIAPSIAPFAQQCIKDAFIRFRHSLPIIYRSLFFRSSRRLQCDSFSAYSR